MSFQMYGELFFLYGELLLLHDFFKKMNKFWNYELLLKKDTNIF